MDASSLRPDTAALWERLQTEPLLAGFTLIGGTALALRIGHRTSEDLDFAYAEGALPRVRLQRLFESLAKDGFALELADHQQDFIVDGVKVTFVVLEPQMRQVFASDAHAPLRVASMDEIFRLKALVCAARSKSRDWFDLYVLMREHGYTMDDFHRAFVDSGQPAKYDIATRRLLSGKPQLADEGYEQVAGAAAPTLGEMRSFFEGKISEFERQQFAMALRVAAQPKAQDEEGHEHGM